MSTQHPHPSTRGGTDPAEPAERRTDSPVMTPAQAKQALHVHHTLQALQTETAKDEPNPDRIWELWQQLGHS